MKKRIIEIYNFVRDDIIVGFNEKDNTPASQVLKDNYGQCNTKAILAMALLRAVGIPCRIHGFIVDKELQKGIVNNFLFMFIPKDLYHTWVELFYNDKWYVIEGIIIDIGYIRKLQKKFANHRHTFCGYGISTKNFLDLANGWNENDTYVQKESIKKDLGVFDNPDDFYKKYKQNLGFAKMFLYRHFARYIMHSAFEKIRKG